MWLLLKIGLTTLLLFISFLLKNLCLRYRYTENTFDWRAKANSSNSMYCSLLVEHNLTVAFIFAFEPECLFLECTSMGWNLQESQMNDLHLLYSKNVHLVLWLWLFCKISEEMICCFINELCMHRGVWQNLDLMGLRAVAGAAHPPWCLSTVGLRMSEDSGYRTHHVPCVSAVSLCFSHTFTFYPETPSGVLS